MRTLAARPTKTEKHAARRTEESSPGVLSKIDASVRHDNEQIVALNSALQMLHDVRVLGRREQSALVERFHSVGFAQPRERNLLDDDNAAIPPAPCTEHLLHGCVLSRTNGNRSRDNRSPQNACSPGHTSRCRGALQHRSRRARTLASCELATSHFALATAPARFFYDKRTFSIYQRHSLCACWMYSGVLGPEFSYSLVSRHLQIPRRKTAAPRSVRHGRAREGSQVLLAAPISLLR